MVADIHDGRQDPSRADDRLDRGQVILIGAVALAFIVLGVVVVFNGVLYTETLSSADSGQRASNVDAIELEIEQGVGCLRSQTNSTVTELADEGELDQFNGRYGNSTANAEPVVVNVSPVDDDELTVEYDSTDTTFTRQLTVTADDCPRTVSVDEYEVTYDDVNETYTANWTVSSRSNDLSNVTVVFADSDDPRNKTNIDGRNESGESTLPGDGGNRDIKIIVRDEAGNAAARIKSATSE